MPPRRARLVLVAVQIAWPCALISALVLRVRNESFTATTGVLFLVTGGWILAQATDWIARALRTPRRKRLGLGVMWSVTVLLVVAAELLMRAGVGGQTTYLESNNGGVFVSMRRHMPHTRLLVAPENGELRISRPEFVHIRRTNSLGLAESEVPTGRAPDEYRIVALGDSFTEGWGAPYEATWVKVMERALSARVRGRRIVTINAGIGGSDPAFEYVLLKERLLPLEPQLVLVAINSSDVTDFVIRGGMDRFLPDGSVRPVVPPWWEWIYGISYISRAVVHGPLGYDAFLMTRTSAAAREQKAVLGIRDALCAFEDLARAHGFRLVVVMQPNAFEVIQGAYLRSLADVASTSESWRSDLIDLLPAFRASVPKTGASELFWTVDGHPKAAGYDIMGRAVAAELLQAGVITP